jgi:murein peptide amidase A
LETSIRQIFKSAAAIGMISFVLAVAHADAPSPSPSEKSTVAAWCHDVQNSINGFKWKIDACKDLDWKMAGTSVEGRPLVYAEFGKEDAPNVTLIFTAVHGDEITPMYLGIQLAHWVKDHEKELGNTRVVIAPLVNPDGFFHKPRRRTNANGVDVNRNFATKDWSASALRSWKIKFRSDPRRYPGIEPRSEPETVFQEDLIRKIRPQKILSVHSPLNHLDYDGPSQLSLNRFSENYVQECLKLRARMRAVTTGFFPGSLGNFAGQELGIPTLTLELPTADPRKADDYWKKFSEGIKLMIEFSMPPEPSLPHPTKATQTSADHSSALSTVQ